MQTSKKPNILFLFTDDQRFDTINALGNSQIKTPNMDKLVKSGTAFTHALIPGGTCGAVCMPSRAMLHSGRTLFHLDGLGENIPAEHTTLGETLKDAGYETIGIGKWHNGHKSYARSFTDGAEIFFGGMDDHWNVPANNFDPNGQYDNIIMSCWDPFYSNRTRTLRCDHVHPGKHSSELFADAAVNILQKQSHEKPFFMYVSFMAPHDPRTMPKEFLDMYNKNEIELPENFMPDHPFDLDHKNIRDEKLASFPRSRKETRQHLAEYYAMITHLDYQIGRILHQLDQIGQRKNTIIILAGDNGLALGQHGLFGKQNIYDHSIRVPLIFSGPAIPQGKIKDNMVYLLDIYPTLCSLLNLESPESVEGKSFAETFTRKTETRQAVYLAYENLMRGVRTQDYKLIEYAVNQNNYTQLFDIKNDPWELNNLAEHKEHKGTLQNLRQQLCKLANEWDDTEHRLGRDFWKNCKNVNPDKSA